MALPPVLAATGKGLVAGAVGTLAMDVLWYRRARSDGSGTDQGFVEWEVSDADRFEDAGAPAQTARKVVSALTPFELPERAAGPANTITHWLTGLQWGALYGAATRLLGTTNPVLGVGLGTAAFAAAYTVLPAIGVYRPITEYDHQTLVKDYTAHALFGLAAAATYRVLSGRR